MEWNNENEEENEEDNYRELKEELLLNKIEESKQAEKFYRKGNTLIILITIYLILSMIIKILKLLGIASFFIE